MTLGGLPLVREVEEQDWGVREAEGVGGMEVQDLQVLVASLWPWSRLRLPDMEERDAFREFLRAGCQSGLRDRGHGCCGLAETPESCKTCLPGDTSFMHLKTGKQKEGRWAGPTWDPIPDGSEMAKRKAMVLLDGAKVEVEMKRSTPEHVDAS